MSREVSCILEATGYIQLVNYIFDCLEKKYCIITFSVIREHQRVPLRAGTFLSILCHHESCILETSYSPKNY